MHICIDIHIHAHILGLLERCFSTNKTNKQFKVPTRCNVTGASPPDDEDNISEEFAQLLSDCAARRGKH